MKNLFVIFCIVGLAACSQFSPSVPARSWHSLNAKYNALLIAQEDYNMARNIVAKKNFNNYDDDALPIFLSLDSTQLDTAKIYLVDAIKKTSLIAERHSNAASLYQAYLLLGDARLLKQEIYNAIQTYKYVYSHADTEHDKDQALVSLMLAYIYNNSLIEAEEISNILTSKFIARDIRNRFYLTKAYLYQRNNEDALAVVLLEKALGSMSKSSEKARLHFICGQIYNQLGQTPLARRHYRQVFKNKPSPAVAFNAELGLILTQSLGHNFDNDFKKLADSRKNTDVLDRVYFKQGELLIKKQEYEKAIEAFNKSIIHVKESNELGKSKAYKSIGDIYFGKLGKLELASLYYDSTIVSYPKDKGSSGDFLDRAYYLNDFIRHKKIYDREDSLQKLARLSDGDLNRVLEKMILERKAKEEKRLEKEIKSLEKQNPDYLSVLKTRWYLYDPIKRAREKSDFIRIWGSRSNVDNWRRSGGTTSAEFERENVVKENALPTPIDTTAQITLSEEVKEEIEKIKLQIPKGQIQLEASNKLKEESLFELAKAYKQKLNEPQKSETTFVKFIQEFPNSDRMPEALYFLSLLNTGNSVYAERLIRDYPHTNYARQAKRGRVTQSENLDKEAESFYTQSFIQYEQGQYETLSKNLESAMIRFVGSAIEDKLAYLNILNLAKVGERTRYVVSLNDFIRSYPSSNLILKVQNALKAFNGK